MRGGFVACLAPSTVATARLESAAGHLRWHVGAPSLHRHGRLQIICLADKVHGPTVEIGGGRLLLCHGGPPEPVEALKRRDRFVGLESDGVALTAIRDPMGEVPLFYRRVDDELWLATEIHPLLGVAPAKPDLAWVTAYSAMVEYPDSTGWLGIKRGLPGETLRIDSDLRVSSHRYFLPVVGVRSESRPRLEAPLRLRELLSKAVTKRCSERCGVLLSGGLDSSAVALVAARTARPVLLTITHPGLPDVDEVGHARAVAEATGIPLTNVEVEPDAWDPAADLELFGTPRLGVPTGMYGIGFRALAEAGCDVALDGHDGDGTLGTLYAWSANTLLDGRPDRFVRAARTYGSGFVLRKLAKDVLSPSLSRLLRLPRASPDSRAALLSYFRGETAARLRLETRWRSPRSGWRQAQLRALLPPTTQFFEESELVAARSGVDVRHPFADRDLIEFVISLPHSVKASTARLKPLLREALADLLPESVAERDDKVSFAPVIDARVDFDQCYRWIRDSGVRLPDLDYGRLFRDAPRPVNDRVFWTRLASAHLFLAAGRR
jgi:asparagine synthase (glutamine-hydrolysing)